MLGTKQLKRQKKARNLGILYSSGAIIYCCFRFVSTAAVARSETETTRFDGFPDCLDNFLIFLRRVLSAVKAMRVCVVCT